MMRPTVLAAMPTPFDASGAVDLRVADRLLAGLADRVDGVFICGTNGEFAALDDDERISLAEVALRHIRPEGIILHIGAVSTGAAVRLAERARSLPLARFAAITPMIHPVKSATVARHFERLREAVGTSELYAYVFEEISGNALLPADYAGLVGIVDGIKTSGFLSSRIGDYLAARPESPAWTGDDGGLVAAVASGARGTVSGCASVLPRVWDDLATALSTGCDVEAAEARAAQVSHTIGKSIAHVRLALAMTGIDPGPARMTFDPVPDDDRESIRALIDQELGSTVTA